MKDILVKLEQDKAHDQALNFAVSVAEAFDAHVAGVTFGSLAGLTEYGMLGVPGPVLSDILAESEKLARASLERFHAAVTRSNLPYSDHLVLDASYGPAHTFATIARHYDLSVVRQSDEQGPDNGMVIEAAMFDTGRPVLVVPYIQNDGLKLNRVLCCWDGGAPAARAINDALPLLKRAADVQVLNVNSDRDPSPRKEIRGIEIANHLARHDVKTDIETISSSDVGVADLILSHAADRSVDLIVMGGYGHSRLREFVLGGVTREILSSMTVPVLLSR